MIHELESSFIVSRIGDWAEQYASLVNQHDLIWYVSRSYFDLMNVEEQLHFYATSLSLETTCLQYIQKNLTMANHKLPWLTMILHGWLQTTMVKNHDAI